MQHSTAQTTEQPGTSAKLTIPCPHCGVVNPNGGDFCHQCNGVLPKGGEDVIKPVSADAWSYKPLSVPPKRLTAKVLVVGAVLLATLVFFGYHAYKILTYVDIRYEKASLPPASNNELGERREPAVSGSIGRVVEDDNPAKSADRRIAPIAMPVDTVRASPAKVNKQATVGSSIPRPKAKVIHEPVEVARPQAVPCTEGISALGLCQIESIKRKE
jgi:hypothetical protein